MAIGSVGVTVVPDADGFWREFQARTGAQANEAGRRAGEEFNRGLRGAADTDIRVRADTAAMRAELDRLRAEVARLNGEINRIGSNTSRSTGQARQSLGLLTTAILTAAPAAVTLGAALVGGLAGVVPTAAAGVLAILGLRDAYKAGTLQGTAFGDQLSALKAEFGRLKIIAAAGVLPGFTSALAALRPLFAPVNAQIATFSGQIGQIAAAAAPALVSILTQLQPLFTTIGDLLVRGAQGLQNFASSGTGLQTFIGYVQANLPLVISTVKDLLDAIGHITGALAPLGPIVLNSLGVIARLITAIPTDVLTGLITVVIAARLAFLGFRVAIIAANLAMSATPVGAIIAVTAAVAAFAFGMSAQSDAAGNAAAANASYAESVKTSTDALNSANLAATNKALTDQRANAALDALHQGNVALSVSYLDLVKAVNGPQAGLDKLTAKFKDSGIVGQSLTGILQTQHDALYQGIDAQEAYNKAQADLRGTLQAVNPLLKAHASAFGVSTDAYKAAADAAKQQTEQMRAQTLQMQLANDAAGLLQQALNGLAGVNLSVASARTALYSANLAVTRSFKDNGNVIVGNTAKAVANQQAIQGNVQAARQFATAVGQQTHSSKAARQALVDSRDALLGQLDAAHRLTPQLRDYITRLYDIKNLKVPPTKLDVDATQAKAQIPQLQAAINSIRQGKVPGLTADSRDGQAAIRQLQNDIDAVKQNKKPALDAYTQGLLDKVQQARDALNSLHDKTVVINTVTVGAGGAGTAIKRASGGAITGPGTGTSDSILARVSNGEFVVNAKQAARHRQLLEAINSGAPGFASGGSVGGSKLDAGQIAALRIQITGSDANSFSQALAGTIYDIGRAFSQMLADAKKIGISDSLVGTLKKETDDLKAQVTKRNQIVAQLGHATEKYADDRKKYLAEVASVANATRGSFDITSAGQNDAGKSSFGSIFAAAKQQASLVKQWAAGIKKLIAEGAGATTVRQLAEDGPASYPQVQALLSATPKQLEALGQVRKEISDVGQSLGVAVGGRDYNGILAGDKANVSSLTQQANILNNSIEKLGLKIEQQFEHAVGAVASRPVNLVLKDGRVLAQLVQSGANKNARRT